MARGQRSATPRPSPRSVFGATSSIRTQLFAPRREIIGWQLTGAADVGETPPTARPACDQCHRPMRYAYRIERGSEMMVVGTGCCREFLGMPGDQALRARIREDKARERAARDARTQAERERIAQEKFDAQRELYDTLRSRRPADGRPPWLRERILDEFAQRIRADRLCILTPKQVALAERLIAREAEREARWRADEARKRPEVHRAGESVGPLTLTVRRLRADTGTYGARIAMTAEAPSGHRYWYRTGTTTRAGLLLGRLSEGDRIELVSGRVRDQASDRCITFLDRATLADT